MERSDVRGVVSDPVVWQFLTGVVRLLGGIIGQPERVDEVRIAGKPQLLHEPEYGGRGHVALVRQDPDALIFHGVHVLRHVVEYLQLSLIQRR